MSFVARVSVSSYRERDRLTKMAADEYAAFHAKCPGWLEIPATQAELAGWYGAAENILDALEMKEISDLGFEMTISRVKGLHSEYISKHTLQDPNHVPIINQVSVSNVGLFGITRVEVHEDFCTRELQTLLDDGWRIIAVCPPNDTRRPTYIVGHTNRNQD